MSKKIFFDCGSNLGQGFEHFRSLLGQDNITYLLFEPNPKCFEQLLFKYSNLPNVVVSNCAVSTVNSTQAFLFTSEFDVGGSIVSDHNNGSYTRDACQEITVKVIDLTQLIDIYHNIGYHIWMKLDIESSEYDILEKLIATGSISKISKIYCEFHSQYMKDPEKSLYRDRETRILSYVTNNNIPFELWH